MQCEQRFDKIGRKRSTASRSPPDAHRRARQRQQFSAPTKRQWFWEGSKISLFWAFSTDSLGVEHERSRCDKGIHTVDAEIYDDLVAPYAFARRPLVRYLGDGYFSGLPCLVRYRNRQEWAGSFRHRLAKNGTDGPPAPCHHLATCCPAVHHDVRAR